MMNTSNINLELQEILKNYDDVIFDTCAILSSGFIPLLKRNALKVEQIHKHLLLHSAVINELIRISRTPENDKYELSNETLYILKALEMKKIFKYIGNNRNLKLADQQFLEFVINYRSQNKILVITLDNDLINDILMENELESYSGNTISVFFVILSRTLIISSKIFIVSFSCLSIFSFGLLYSTGIKHSAKYGLFGSSVLK